MDFRSKKSRSQPRRNLTPLQRIAITERYRPIYEEKAKENKQIAAEKMNNTFSADLPKTIEQVDTRKELAKLAGVGERTYSKAVAILNSDNICNTIDLWNNLV